MSAFLDILSWGCLAGGGFFCVVGSIGLLRMPDFYTRMHAASVTETLGAGLILLGALILAGFTLAGAKLVMIGLLVFFASPTASHALAKAAMSRGLKPVLAEPPSAAPDPPLPQPLSRGGERGAS